MDTLAIFILSKDVYWDCNSITREGEQIVHRTSYDYGSSRSGCDCQVVYHWRIERDRIVIQYFVVIHFFNKDVTREILSYNPIETQRNWCSWALVTIIIIILKIVIITWSQERNCHRTNWLSGIIIWIVELKFLSRWTIGKNTSILECIKYHFVKLLFSSKDTLDSSCNWKGIIANGIIIHMFECNLSIQNNDLQELL